MPPPPFPVRTYFNIIKFARLRSLGLLFQILIQDAFALYFNEPIPFSSRFNLRYTLVANERGSPCSDHE
jgi:hypothetical protein